MPAPRTKKQTTRKKKRAKVRAVKPDKKTPTLEVPAPIPLGEVLGQGRAIGLLESAARSGRLAHAWLFHGPEGVGKLTTALAFAAAILDATTAVDLSGNWSPDPDSPVQALLAAGTHPDLHVVCKELAAFSHKDTIRKSKQRSIALDVVHEFLIEPAQLRPSLPGGVAQQVFIVNEAEMLWSEAQNALLKTLEEPGAGTVLILVTSSEDRLLPTIRSRCQRVAFAPLKHDDMDAWCARAGVDTSGDERAWLMRYADGSPGRLLCALEGGLYEWHTRLAPMLDAAGDGRFDPACGPVMNRLVDDWAKAAVKAGEKRNQNVSKDAANVLGARQIFALAAEHFRPMLADPTRSAHAAWAVERIAEAERRLASNVQMATVFDALVAEIAGGEGAV